MAAVNGTYGTAAPVAAPIAGKRRVSPTHDVILYFLALFIPPLAVFFKRGIRADFWINILLWILGWIPGVLHAWYIISRSEGYM
ncbi:Plasma membrane proteolipid 3 [Sparassis crispa]|uniref:Plasma membrane proteolipid 3 n=1 Tax=Sparassis crispa TaxID=139825 RepID=A0A401GZL7_9APHY|nr:Plasma membrane proteolipid 3 [Sparassis crispa]GBE87600.1 Plasma membrane proteolipid 3 [Sparassis crispa]